ncbi:MAG: DUF1640 domain-containing protein [Chloroflexi bacterium]|nr:DUF1640 domain-containing protein [Chloroflexota bacterium]
MLDTHAVARSLTAANFTPAQADALTDALREFTERGDHVTSDQFKAGQAEVRAEITELRSEQRTQIAEVRTEIANLDTRLSKQIAEVRTEIGNLEARLIKWIIGTVVTTAGVTVAIAGVVVGVLRLLAAE